MNVYNGISVGPALIGHALIKSTQCRAARAFLGWTEAELSAISNVPIETIVGFEANCSAFDDDDIVAIRKAFEAAGIQFLADGLVLPTS